MREALQHDGSRDFDFLIGRWHIHNHRLTERLQGSDVWEDFEASGTFQLLPGNMGNIDDFTTDHWPGFVGMSLRLFNPATQQWSIYWNDNRINTLQPPVVGSFAGGIGRFEGADEFQGKAIRVRFIWSDITETSARWEQAFSDDGGENWETNWVMSFSRLDNSQAV